MLPRPARLSTDYRDLDLSFLDDEPPPGPAAKVAKRRALLNTHTNGSRHRQTPSSASSGASSSTSSQADPTFSTEDSLVAGCKYRRLIFHVLKD